MWTIFPAQPPRNRPAFGEVMCLIGLVVLGWVGAYGDERLAQPQRAAKAPAAEVARRAGPSSLEAAEAVARGKGDGGYSR